MAGMNFQYIASALVRFIGREIRRSARHRGRRGRRGHPGPAAEEGLGNPPAAIHHAYQAPPPPAAVAPPMDWLLNGPAAPLLGEEDGYDADLFPPPPGIFFDSGMDAGVAFCPVHGYGPYPARDGANFYPVHGYDPIAPPPATPPPEPEVVDEPAVFSDLPTPTPTVEDGELFAPPGFGPVPATMEWEVTPTEEEEQWLAAGVKQEPLTRVDAADASAPILDLNIAPGAQNEDEASSSEPPRHPAPTPPRLPTLASPPPPPTASPPPPPPEARRILRRFAAALEQHRPGLRASAWAPAGLNLPGYAAEEGGSS